MISNSSGKVDLIHAHESIGRIRRLETWLPATGAMAVQGLLPNLDPEDSQVPASACLIASRTHASEDEIQGARRLLEKYLDWKMLERVDPEDAQERERIRLTPVRSIDFLIDCHEILEDKDPAMLWEFLAMPNEERGFLSIAGEQAEVGKTLQAKFNPPRETGQGNKTPIDELIKRARQNVEVELRYNARAVYTACLQIIESAKGQRLEYLPHVEFGINGDSFFYKLPPAVVKNTYARTSLKKYLDRRRGKEA